MKTKTRKSRKDSKIGKPNRDKPPPRGFSYGYGWWLIDMSHHLSMNENVFRKFFHI